MVGFGQATMNVWLSLTGSMKNSIRHLEVIAYKLNTINKESGILLDVLTAIISYVKSEILL
jgi:hypothetical protein